LTTLHGPLGKVEVERPVLGHGLGKVSLVVAASFIFQGDGLLDRGPAVRPLGGKASKRFFCGLMLGAKNLSYIPNPDEKAKSSRFIGMDKSFFSLDLDRLGGWKC
jgi:hypothetical protein